MAIRRAMVTAAFAILAITATPGRAAAGQADTVVYTSDVTTLQGNWAKVSGNDAAGGQYLSSADNGWSSTDAPLASPSHYFEANISAAGSTTYHIWLRLRGAGNSKWNESVWVQFSDAVDQGVAHLPDWDDQRAAREPGELQRLRHFGLGLAGSRVLAESGTDRSIPVDRHPDDSRADPRGRRADRSDRPQPINLSIERARTGGRRQHDRGEVFGLRLRLELGFIVFRVFGLARGDPGSDRGRSVRQWRRRRRLPR